MGKFILALVATLLLGAEAAIAEPPKVGSQPLVQVKPKTPTNSKALIEQLRACLTIDDMTKERLDCYDAIVPPQPKPKPPVAKIVTDCRFLKEEDERLVCFNRFIERPATRPASAHAIAPPPSSYPIAIRHSTKRTYVRRGRGGCGSRGGAGYRLPNGKCASRRR